jgi:hypothetical protein
LFFGFFINFLLAIGDQKGLIPKILFLKIQFGKCRYEFEKAPSYPGNGKN